MVLTLCHLRLDVARSGRVIKEFSVLVGHTINLGNYESLRVEAGVTVSVEESDWETVRMQAQEALKTLLQDSFHEQAKPAWFAQIPGKRIRT
jgi:hypothetical protein